MIEQHAGRDVAGRYRAPWTLRDPDELLAIVHAAGFADVELHVEPAMTRFPSIEAFLLAKTATLIAGRVDAETLAADAAEALAPYCVPDGAVNIPGPGHIATATKT